MIKSEQINELATALSLAQGEMKNVIKSSTAKIRTKTGAEFSYSYAQLGDVLELALPILSKHGLAITQGSTTEVNQVVITTILLHKSDQFIESNLKLPIVDTGNNAIQAIGSSMTYGRRYEVSSILGIASEEDDDANGLSQAKSTQQSKPTQQTAPRPAVQKANGNGEHKEIPTLTLKDMVIKMGFEKFGSDDAFHVWRVDNNFPEDLETAKQMDLAKIMTLLREVKPIGAR